MDSEESAVAPDRVIVGTRGSRLALLQTGIVINRLKRFYPETEFDIRRVSTGGDRARDWQAVREEEGIFVKEIENELLAGKIDMAVHSVKDLPVDRTAGLTLAAVLERGRPEDAFISRKGQSLEDLSGGAVIGTSSLRRRAQIKRLRPDLKLSELRGNVDTRLRKLDEGAVDGIVLAAAGVIRSGLEERITQILPLRAFLPAPAQGALGIETRIGDGALAEMAGRVDHGETRSAVEAERSLLKSLGGGCRVPVGAYAEALGGKLSLEGLVISLDGSRMVRSRLSSDDGEAGSLGRELAGVLLQMGAGEILDAAREAFG